MKELTYLYQPCSHKKPHKRGLRDIESLFMAVFEGFSKKTSKTASDKVPFLLVRFLWANKENEQDNTAKSTGFKMSLIEKQALKTRNEYYFSI